MLLGREGRKEGGEGRRGHREGGRKGERLCASLCLTCTYMCIMSYTDEYITMKQMAAVRFHRNHRLMLEIFNNVSVPDTRTVVNKSRLQLLKKQVQSLTIHQVSYCVLTTPYQN